MGGRRTDRGTPTETRRTRLRWARREPLTAALAAALAVFAIVIMVGLVVSNVIISRERDLARTQRRIAQDESRHADRERKSPSIAHARHARPLMKCTLRSPRSGYMNNPNYRRSSATSSRRRERSTSNFPRRRGTIPRSSSNGQGDFAPVVASAQARSSTGRRGDALQAP